MTSLIKFISRHFPFVRNFYRYYLNTRKFLIRLTHPFSWYHLRSLKPVSNLYGLDRGQSVDRFYIENFLAANKKYIKGNVLEVADPIYTRRFGGKKVKHSEILDINKKNKFATIYDDLRAPKNLKPNTYDCIILTQVLQFIDDNPSAIKTCYSILKKGGVLLVTVPCFSRADVASGISGDFWRFTVPGLLYLFKPIFGAKNLTIKSWGNVLSGTAFWQGISLQELKPSELKHNDPNFPVLITLKAVKK